MNNHKIDAVIFDLDGIITDTAHFHFLAWKQLAEEIGISIDEEFNERLKGISRMDSLELILEEGNRQHDFTSIEKEEMAERKNANYVNYLDELTPEHVLPGIMDLIKSIKTDGIPIGLASVSKNAETVLRALNLVEAFDYCADASKISKSKPDPEIFLTACKGLNAVPERSIGIEDAVAGVESIKASGMFAVGVGKQLSKADYQLMSTGQLQWEKIKEAFNKWND
ncbi:beta-phosphoglucomutase [Fictibacillus barbaricus]|uniref:Beta-phosphoglucomutase n=1 Tax=Fictibacillus barbaricus TaxID=182136 RepID=A0ABS2ZIV8_9BACL|nr:beta-phosphoglucomutase [Fictibacillus barbaricus]MBN3546581.1 beta-phosphoglucomutase [Fictibacillus barbaricus]GGB42155.1 beta-phosphoglucomutase [Fictibacillus barbaricus]